MRRGVAIIALLGLGLAGFLAGCGSSGSKSSSSTSTTSTSGEGGQKTIAGLTANNHGTKQANSSGKTEVELDDFYFEPTVIEGSPGQKVKLELKNEGKTEHSFTVDSQKIDQTLSPGDETEVTVTIPKSGVVSFYCKFHYRGWQAGSRSAARRSAGAAAARRRTPPPRAATRAIEPPRAGRSR